MKAITDKLHEALEAALLQLPQGQVEGLVAGLRSAEPIPEPVVEQLKASAKARAKETLAKQLEALEGDPDVG
jgi:hypothetical protein